MTDEERAAARKERQERFASIDWLEQERRGRGIAYKRTTGKVKHFRKRRAPTAAEVARSDEERTRYALEVVDQHAKRLAETYDTGRVSRLTGNTAGPPHYTASSPFVAPSEFEDDSPEAEALRVAGREASHTTYGMWANATPAPMTEDWFTPANWPHASRSLLNSLRADVGYAPLPEIVKTDEEDDGA